MRPYPLIRFAAVLPALLLSTFGCSPVPGRTLSLSPAAVDFGTRNLNQSVRVAAPAPGANLAIRVSCDARWLSITPAQLFSSGPGDESTVTLSIVRALMKPGRNTCRVVLAAAGHADTIIQVSGDAIVSADFRVPDVALRPGELVLFTDATRVLTGAEPITVWKWDFGDGATSMEQNPVHAYEGKGIYTVTLAVTSASGSDVRIRPNCVTIAQPALPSADFVAATRRRVAGTPIQFRDLSVPGGSSIIGWLWDFGDGGWSGEQHPLHLYSAAAIYDVYLSVRNTNGMDTSLKLGYVDVQPNRRR